MVSYGTVNKEQPAAGASSKVLLALAGLALFAAGAVAGSTGVGPKTIALYKRDGDEYDDYGAGEENLAHGGDGDGYNYPIPDLTDSPCPVCPTPAVVPPDIVTPTVATPPVTPGIVTPTVTTPPVTPDIVTPTVTTPPMGNVAPVAAVAAPAVVLPPAVHYGMPGTVKGMPSGMSPMVGEVGGPMGGPMVMGGPMGGPMGGGMAYGNPAPGGGVHGRYSYMAKDKSETPKQPNLFLPSLVLAAVAFALGWLSSMTYRNLVAAAPSKGMKAPLMVDPEA